MRWSPTVVLFSLLLHVRVLTGQPTSAPDYPATPPRDTITTSTATPNASIPLAAYRQQRRQLLHLLADIANASPLLLPSSQTGAICFTFGALVRRHQPPTSDVDIDIVLRPAQTVSDLRGPLLCRYANGGNARIMRVREAAVMLGWGNWTEKIREIEHSEERDLYKTRSEGWKGDDDGMSRTQVFVIATCSAVIGTFFLVAAIMRFRNYLQRKQKIRRILRCESPLRIRRLSSIRTARRGRRPTETRLDTGVIDIDAGEVLKYLSATEQERRVQIEDVPDPDEVGPQVSQSAKHQRRCSCPQEEPCCPGTTATTAPPNRRRSRIMSLTHSTSAPPMAFLPTPIAAVSRSSSASQLPSALPLPHVDLPNVPTSPRRAYQPLTLLPTTAATAMAPAGLLSCRCRMAAMGWTCAHRRFYQRMLNPLYDPTLSQDEEKKEKAERPPNGRRRSTRLGVSPVGSSAMPLNEEEDEHMEVVVEETLPGNVMPMRHLKARAEHVRVQVNRSADDPDSPVRANPSKAPTTDSEPGTDALGGATAEPSISSGTDGVADPTDPAEQASSVSGVASDKSSSPTSAEAAPQPKKHVKLMPDQVRCSPGTSPNHAPDLTTSAEQAWSETGSITVPTP